MHPRPPTGLHGWAAGAASALAYGSMPVVAVFAFNGGASPTVLLTLRGVFAIAAILTIWVVTGRVRRVPWPAAVGLIMVCGVIFGAQVVAFFAAVQLGGAQLPVVVVNVCPLLVIGLVWLRDRTPVPLTLILLALVTIVGLVFVGATGASATSLAAVGLTLLSAAGYAVYLVASERWVHQVGTVASAGLVTIGSTATVAVFALVNGDRFAVAAPVWHTAILQGLVLTPVGMGGALYAVRSLGSVPLSLLGALEPVIGLTLAAVLLHESLAPMQWVGVVIIVAACTAVPLVSRRQPAAQSAPPLTNAAGVGEVAVPRTSARTSASGRPGGQIPACVTLPKFTLVRGPAGVRCFGTLCCQSRWQRPRMISTSPPAGMNVVLRPPVLGRIRNRRVAPRLSTGTIAVCGMLAGRSACQLVLSRWSRYQFIQSPSYGTPQYSLSAAARPTRNAGAVAKSRYSRVSRGSSTSRWYIQRRRCSHPLSSPS